MKLVRYLLTGIFTLSLWLTSSVSYSVEREIIVVANKRNPVNTLSLRQVKQIFLGRLRSFPNMDDMVKVADREDSSGVYAQFYSDIVRMNPSRLKRYRARYLFSGQGLLPLVKSSQDALSDFINEEESSIGYMDIEKGQPLPKGIKVLYRYSYEKESGDDIENHEKN